MAPRKHPGQAVIIGGSLAGLFAARVLSERFDSVVILERDDLEKTGEGRRGVPQGRHAHALLDAGRARIGGWFPGIEAELIDGGAAVGDPGVDLYWHQGGALRAKYPTGEKAAITSRPFLEEAVRARVEKIDNVELRTGVHAEGLVSTDDKTRVTGVVLTDGSTLDATLVLDCTGRMGVTLKWIEELGYAKPAVEEVGIDMRYTTRVFKKNPDMARDWEIALVIGDPPDSRLAACFPMEGDRWMVTLCGYHGDHAPSDDAGFLAFAKQLPSQVIADVIERCEPIGDYRTHRMQASQRRRVDRLRAAPAGWALFGDAVSSFNPVYGQGMSSAALQAEALGHALDAHTSGVDAALTRRIHKGAIKATRNAWSVSTGGDFAHPKTTGKEPPGNKLINRYVDRVVKAAQTDVEVAKAIDAVGNLVANPESLMKPRILRRVLFAKR
jgi:2-polyprenyl-6-methoxyphenol hydroxylase-like FAD-dependent oxidoreductase